MKKLLLDVDPGIDDAVAIAYAVADPNADLLAVACSAGNTTAEQATANALAWLDLAGAGHLEVAQGAATPLSTPLVTTPETHGPTGSGWAQLPLSTRAVSPLDAADLWIEIARRYPGEVTGVLTGPATNLALAVQRDPELPQLLDRLVVMGGSFNYPGNTTPVAEWNVAVDPEAAKQVLDSFGSVPPQRLPIVCGLNVTERVMLRSDQVAQLAELAQLDVFEPFEAGAPDGSRQRCSNLLLRHLLDALRFYFEFHRDYDRIWACHLHDPFALGVALDHSWATLRPACVDVELTGSLTRGATIADFDQMWGRPANAYLAVETEPDRFVQHVVRQIAELARTSRSAD